MNVTAFSPDTFRCRLLQLVLGGLAACLLANVCRADGIYTCRDAGGHMITSDRPIPECANRAMQQLNANGTVMREIAAPLTQEQLRQQEAEARRRIEQAVGERERHRKDQALLNTYGNLSEIEVARKRTLTDLDLQIRVAYEHMAMLDKDRKANETEAEFYKNKKMPGVLKAKMDDNKAFIEDQIRAIQDLKDNVNRVNERFDAEVKRYRELTGG